MNFALARGFSISSISLILLCALTGGARAQSRQPSISLDPPTGWELQAHAFDSKGNRLPETHSNFRRLGEAQAGELADLHTLTLRFAENVKLTGLRSTRDFRIEQGGSCIEGNVYEAKSACTLLVRFTPQGAGRRTGRIEISHTGFGSPTPMVVSGFSYQPVISFVPAVITTLPGSYPAGKGLLSGAQNLAIDGGDTLYVADTSNNAIRMYGATNTFTTLSTPSGSPLGVAADSYGQVYFSIPSANVIDEILDYGLTEQASGVGTDACTLNTNPCTLGLEAINAPGPISIDANDTMIFEEDTNGAALSQLQPNGPTLLRLYDPFAYPISEPVAFGVDANQTLYTAYTALGYCQINTQPLADAEQFVNDYSKVAGGRVCGFAGDGGRATNAEISASIGQIAFDQANDLYFADTGNQRVRRVDHATGIIHTIAGTGVAGYLGDNGGATAARLSSPTGVAVDSQGQVYIISSAATGQVIRKVGTTGYRNLGSQLKGTKSAPFTVALTNTGNSSMTLTNHGFKGGNVSDFAIDPLTTSCNLTAGAVLNVGQTCQIGFVFTPSAAGVRSTTFVMTDNTVTNSNTIDLTGTGTLPAPIFKITSPANGASFTSSATVTLAVSVTSSSGAQPTGTVQFKLDGANEGSPVVLSSTGTASKSISSLTQTTHTLSATYSGDTAYAAAGPISVSITVTQVKIVPLVSLSPSINAAGSCGAQSFMVAVWSESGPVPTGEVQVLDGSALLGSASLANGRATLAMRGLAAGSHSLTARYAGDALHLPAVSSALVENVGPTRPCTLPVSGSGARTVAF